MQTLYTPTVTLIKSSWLNDVDAATYNALSAVAGTNTITATGPTTVTAYAANQRFVFTPANTNTGATTISISSIGAKNVFLNGQALSGGELLISVPLLVQYDGTQFNIVANGYQRLKISPNASGRNIAARTNSGTPNTKLDITADELILTNSTGNAMRVTSVSGTIDFGVVGANGIDAGSQASSTWYYGWVIAKEDGTVALLGSLSSTAPTLPTGYTFKALVTAARSDPSVHFLKYRQTGNTAYFEASQRVLTGGSASTETSITITSAVPPNALAFQGYISGSGSTSAGGAAAPSLFLRTVSGSNQLEAVGAANASSQLGFANSGIFPNISQTLFYLFTPTTNVASISINVDIPSFKLPCGGE